MQLANLDMIVRRTLLERSLPIHYYSEILYHESSAIRELAKDSLQIVNSANLPIDTYGAIDLPMDFVDDVAVTLPFGGLLQPIPKRDNINPIRVHNPTTGQFVPYINNNVNTINNTANTIFGYNPGAVWFWNINDWGEPTGRYFGANGGSPNGYKVIRERRQIQLLGLPDSSSVILLYISNGQSVDNATQVDWRAFRAIQTYSDWQRSPNAVFKDSGEANTYYNEKRLFRANTDDMTTTDIKNIIRHEYTAAVKN